MRDEVENPIDHQRSEGVGTSVNAAPARVETRKLKLAPELVEFLPALAVSSDSHLGESWKNVQAVIAEPSYRRENWDGQRATPLDPRTGDLASSVCDALAQAGFPVPDEFGPTVNGAVRLGWYGEALSLEIEIPSPARLETGGLFWQSSGERAQTFAVLDPL